MITMITTTELIFADETPRNSKRTVTTSAYNKQFLRMGQGSYVKTHIHMQMCLSHRGLLRRMKGFTSPHALHSDGSRNPS